MAVRVALVAGGLGLWFLTQSLLRYRPSRKVLGRPHGGGWSGIRLSPTRGGLGKCPLNGDSSLISTRVKGSCIPSRSASEDRTIERR
jgi:hypothetical protein